MPQSAWYAYGLLLRGGPGDGGRAVRILEALLALQIDAPGRPFHGTFSRFAESPPPGDDAVVWQDYDPNWRQFLGTAFLVVLEDFPEALPVPLVAALSGSLRLAVEGEPADRVAPSYANIALMRAFLETEAGHRLGEEDWIRRGLEIGREAVAVFDRHGCFEEYNSATYYGIDLFALALWRSRAREDWLRRAGARLEAALWRDVARWYHPGLRNLCGPFTRTYGMDMERTLSLLGVWIGLELGRAAAPLPDFDDDLDHGHDAFATPLLAALGTHLPREARDALAGEPDPGGLPRRLRQRIAQTPRREASGWLGPRSMAGGERCDADLSFWDQYVAATLHWRVDPGSLGWLALRAPGPSRADAVERGLDVEWPPCEARPEAPAILTLSVPGLDPRALREALGASDSGCGAREAALPGGWLRLESDARLEAVEEGRGGRARLRFARPAPGAAARFRIRLDPEEPAP